MSSAGEQAPGPEPWLCHPSKPSFPTAMPLKHFLILLIYIHFDVNGKDIK